MKKHISTLCALSLVLGVSSLSYAQDQSDDSTATQSSEERVKKHDRSGKSHDRGRERHEKRMEEYLLNKIDTDQDGKVSYDEFMANAKSRFETSDLDSDGFISLEERKEAAEIMRKKYIEAKRDARKSRHAESSDEAKES